MTDDMPNDPFAPLIGLKLKAVERPDEETLILVFEGGIEMTMPNENWMIDFDALRRS